MTDVFVSRLGWSLGGRCQSVEDAARREQLLSDPAALRQAGFATHHVCTEDESAYALARAALGRSGVEADKIDVLLYSTCLPALGQEGGETSFRHSRDVKDLMRFPAMRLQAEHGLVRANVIGIHQQACTGMLGTLRVGRALMTAESGVNQVLCLTADRFPSGARYEQAYNLISDGAAACLLSRSRGDFRLLGVHHLSVGAMLEANDDQTAGSFFSYSCRIADELLAAAGMSMSELRWFVPQNLNRAALDVLTRLLELPADRVWCPDVARIGHVISADNVINLASLKASGRLQRGDRVLTSMAGFGSHWQAALLEVA